MTAIEFTVDGYKVTIEASQNGRSKTIVVRDAFGFIKGTITAKNYSDLEQGWEKKFRWMPELRSQLATVWNSI